MNYNNIASKPLLQVLRLNFGKWGPTGDPLQAILFYDKNGEVAPAKTYDQVIIIIVSMTTRFPELMRERRVNFTLCPQSSLFVPSSWSQEQLRMYCRSEDPGVVDLAKR